MSKENQIGIRELAEGFASNPMALIRRGAENGMSLSATLEAVNPSEGGERIDAFGRLARELGVVLYSDPRMGIHATEVRELLDGGAAKRAIFAEHWARVQRDVMFGRATYLSSDAIEGSTTRPSYTAPGARLVPNVAPPIALSEVVAITSGVDAQTYQATYLDYDAEAARKYRVGEGADIPLAKIVTRDEVTRLLKYGRGMRMTYEQLRRMRIDLLSYHVAMMAVQDEIDKVTAALDVLVSGATTYALTALDSGTTANNLTAKAWIAFISKFLNGYSLTSALMRETTFVDLFTLDTGNSNWGLTQLTNAAVGGFTIMNGAFSGTRRIGFTADAPASQIVGFDRARALQMVFEIGSQITETERFIQNQTQEMYMTENMAFVKLDGNATRILNLAA